MSEFQTSLLVIGAAVVAGVIGYNRWQERQAARSADEAFRSNHPDVLIGAERDALPALTKQRADTKVEPGIGSRPLISPGDQVGDGEIPCVPEPSVDYVVEIASERPLLGSTVLDSWKTLEHRFASRTRLCAVSNGAWRAVSPQDSFETLRASIQLVSRAGVLGEGELFEFRSVVESMAAKFGASAHSPEMRDSLEAARELDAVCVDADIQVAFHVVALPGTTFIGTKLRAAAEASGFALDGDGRFWLRDDDGRELYCLGDREGAPFSAATMKESAPLALTLSMDVPTAPDTQRTFEAMVRFGRHLTALLGGNLVDDNNLPLDDRSVDAIVAQLSLVRKVLVERGLTPGSALALRLFS